MIFHVSVEAGNVRDLQFWDYRTGGSTKITLKTCRWRGQKSTRLQNGPGSKYSTLTKLSLNVSRLETVRYCFWSIYMYFKHRVIYTLAESQVIVLLFSSCVRSPLIEACNINYKPVLIPCYDWREIPSCKLSHLECNQ